MVINLPVAGCSSFILPHLLHIFSKSSVGSNAVILWSVMEKVLSGTMTSRPILLMTVTLEYSS